MPSTRIVCRTSVSTRPDFQWGLVAVGWSSEQVSRVVVLLGPKVNRSRNADVNHRITLPRRQIRLTLNISRYTLLELTDPIILVEQPVYPTGLPAMKIAIRKEGHHVDA